MAKKLSVAVFFGGKSAEREISKISADFILKNLDPKKYSVSAVELDSKGTWPAKTLQDLFSKKFDAVFPVLHGPNGEDGTIQGMFELSGTPYVGCGVLASAVCMDKEAACRLILQAGLPVPEHLAAHKHEWEKKKAALSKQALAFGLPLFVKPARLGSSVGISKVKTAKELNEACENAFRYDTKIMIQKGINAREIECAVLGSGGDIFVSVPGEIIPKHEFYSYEAKYLDPQGADLRIPADLNATQAAEVREFAKQSFLTLGCEGMGRADFLLDKDTGRFYFNEINTIPGFTSISMYPKMMEASGFAAPKLLDKLIDLARKRFEERSKLSQEHPKK